MLLILKSRTPPQAQSVAARENEANAFKKRGGVGEGAGMNTACGMVSHRFNAWKKLGEKNNRPL